MSFLGTAIAVGIASKLGDRENYLLGIDLAGANIEADAKSNGNEAHVQASTYWTSVAAGLTVVVTWALVCSFARRA